MNNMQGSSPGALWTEVTDENTTHDRLVEIAKDSGAGLWVLNKLLEREPELATHVKNNELIKTLTGNKNFWSNKLGKVQNKDMYSQLYTQLGYEQLAKEAADIDIRRKRAAVAAGMKLAGAAQEQKPNETSRRSPQTLIRKPARPAQQTHER